MPTDTKTTEIAIPRIIKFGVDMGIFLMAILCLILAVGTVVFCIAGLK